MPPEYLNVFRDERLVGMLSGTRTGRLRFRYAQSWIESPDGHSVSFSLPLQEQEFDHEASTNFFENILPEEDSRIVLARASRLDQKDVFGFLRRFGRECAGALAILPEGESPIPDNEYEDVTEQLESILRDRKIMGIGVGLVAVTGARLSLAGAQDKLPVRYAKGRFYLPVRYAATTHIIKPENPRFHGLAVNEYFCMCLARHMGLPVADHHIVSIGDTPLYITQRFDRETTPAGNVRRLHQEDFCQALGVNATKKYEELGGPGFRQCLNLVSAHHFSEAVSASSFFTRAAILNYLIGNNDAHSKNFSILRTPLPCLAPLYDLVSTEIYPGLDQRVSMSIGGRFVKNRIDADSWERFAHEMQREPEDFFDELRNMAETALGKMPDALMECKTYDADGNVLQRLRECVENNASTLLRITPHLDNDDSPSP